MNFSPNKTPIEIIEMVILMVLVLATFFLVLMRSGTQIHGKNLFI